MELCSSFFSFSSVISKMSQICSFQIYTSMEKPNSCTKLKSTEYQTGGASWALQRNANKGPKPQTFFSIHQSVSNFCFWRILFACSPKLAPLQLCTYLPTYLPTYLQLCTYLPASLQFLPLDHLFFFLLWFGLALQLYTIRAHHRYL